MIKYCDVCNTEVLQVKHYSLFKNDIWLGTDYTQRICICQNCGFIYVQNPLSQKQLDKQYKMNSKYEFDNKTMVIQDGYKRRCVEQKSFIENSLKTRIFESILEVGAASGYNLSLYTDKTTLGIEPSKWNCDNARKMYGVEMYSGTFDEYIHKFPKKSFDLIFLSHTLEHIVNPYDFVKTCAKINTNYCFIEVPSFDYKLQDEPFGMFTDEHVNLFTFESLQNLMNGAGYQLVNAEIPFCVGDIAPSGYPSLRTLWEKSLTIKPIKAIFSTSFLFDQYLAWSEMKMKDIQKRIDAIPDSAKVAVWGIGNTASRILGSTGLERKHIVRAYDSDTRKHGLEFCGQKIIAFNPVDVEQNFIDIILITTCTAQNVLLKSLEVYKDKINIITLFDI